jgi:ketose-bisphosphate aldolase
MALQATGQILQKARTSGYCVGAFNVVDFLTMEAVIRAGNSLCSPVIIQTSAGVVRRYGASMLHTWAYSLAERYPIPIGLHLDHCTEEDIILSCIESGYSSVMIDASHFPFAENVERTKRVVSMAHQAGVDVEGEIGIMAGVEDDLVVQQDSAIYTTPEEAITFQSASGVDFLAVAIGTAHGFYHIEPRLDIDTLRNLHARVAFPLVVHGGTGLSTNTLQELVAAGASKLNVSTQLKKTYMDALKAYLQQYPDEYNPMKMLECSSISLIELVSRYVDVFKSAGRA